MAKSAKTLYVQAKGKLGSVYGRYEKSVNKKENLKHHSKDLIRDINKMVCINIAPDQILVNPFMFSGLLHTGSGCNALESAFQRTGVGEKWRKR